MAFLAGCAAQACASAGHHHQNNDEQAEADDNNSRRHVFVGEQPVHRILPFIYLQ